MSREAAGLIVDRYRGNLQRGPADQRCFDVADIYLESEFHRPKSVEVADPACPVVDLPAFTVAQALSESEGEELSGRYFSEELDVMYHVSVEEGRLWVRLNDIARYEVFPRSLILFQRADDSSVTGFRLDDPRVTNIRFMKQGLPLR